MSRILTEAAAVVAVGLLALTACTSTPAAASPAAPGSAAPAGQGVKIGLALSTLNNPFFVSLQKGAQEAAKAAGADLTVTDARDDATQQANQIQNFSA